MPTAGDRVSFGSFSLRFKENEPGCRAGTRRFRLFFKGYKAKANSSSGGRGPRRRLTLLLRDKRVSRKTRPGTWPFGFPAHHQFPSRSQNSAAPQTFLAYSAGNRLRSGCGARGMFFNRHKFSEGFPGRDGLQKKSRVARWRQHHCSQMGPTKTEAGTSRKAVAKEPNDRDRNAHRR